MNTDQIADEALDKIHESFCAWGAIRDVEILPIIKSAIEKAQFKTFGLCLSHRAAYRLSNPSQCPICRLIEEMASVESRAAQGSEKSS